MKTILIVEDNDSIRDEICDIFTMENYKVINATNGLDGYIKATSELPDIIISDLMMPIWDGYKMFREIKKNTLTDNIPIIFLSALSADDDIRKGMNIGADDYLTKPIKTDDLIKATTSRLQKHSKLNKKTDELKIDITNVLYHELNTPLNGIIGFSDYLVGEIDTISKNNVKEIVSNIYKSGIRLHKLVNKYLCYSELKIKSNDISEIRELRKCSYIETEKKINEILCCDIYEDRKDDFVTNINPVNFKINKSHFKIMIGELIENAVKFSKKGTKIYIESTASSDLFIIKIKNIGRGLSPQQIEKISDFRQFNKKELAQNGSGIGLSIVKLISDFYNGKVEIKSSPNKYFTIAITFKNSFKRQDSKVQVSGSKISN